MNKNNSMNTQWFVQDESGKNIMLTEFAHIPRKGEFLVTEDKESDAIYFEVIGISYFVTPSIKDHAGFGTAGIVHVKSLSEAEYFLRIK